MFLQPGKQCRAEVEADMSIVVRDLLDVLVAVQNPGSAVRGIALRGDTLIPIVERIRRILQLNELKPCIFSGWLIKMAVDTDVPIH